MNKMRKWFLINSLIIIVVLALLYTFFVNIPFLYDRIANVNLLKVGKDYARLNSNVLTNFIYMILLVAGLFGMIQVWESRKLRRMNSLSAFFNILYDEKNIKYKSALRKTKNYYLGLYDREAYKMGDDPPRFDIDRIKADIKQFEETLEKLECPFEHSAQILTLYNNIGLLIEKELLELKYLPVKGISGKRN